MSIWPLHAYFFLWSENRKSNHKTVCYWYSLRVIVALFFYFTVKTLQIFNAKKLTLCTPRRKKKSTTPNILSLVENVALLICLIKRWKLNGKEIWKEAENIYWKSFSCNTGVSLQVLSPHLPTPPPPVSAQISPTYLLGQSSNITSTGNLPGNSLRFLVL